MRLSPLSGRPPAARGVSAQLSLGLEIVRIEVPAAAPSPREGMPHWRKSRNYLAPILIRTRTCSAALSAEESDTGFYAVHEIRVEVFVPAFAAWRAALRRPAPPAMLAQQPTLS